MSAAPFSLPSSRPCRSFPSRNESLIYPIFVSLVKKQVNEMISSEVCFKPLPQLIEELNRHLKGWANYFSYGYPRKGFRQINRYVRQRLTQHVQRRSQRPFRPAEGVSYYEHFKRMGLVYL